MGLIDGKGGRARFVDGKGEGIGIGLLNGTGE